MSRNFRFDTWRFRTQNESLYGNELANYDPTDAYGRLFVDSDLIFWLTPLLKAEFRYISHRNPNGRRFFSMARWERSTSTRTGFFIPWKDIQATRIKRNALEGRYPRVPRLFKDYEVSKQFFAELPPVVSYVASYLLADPESGYWAVFLTGWTCRVAATLLWEVYDTYRLFNLPRFLISTLESKNIDLACVLGSRENERELKELLDVIKEVDFDNLPQEMVGYTNEETPDGSRKPAPKSPGGQNNPKGLCDFIWYDPWEKKEVTREEVL